ncbi:energy-coupling factor ABC transporter ATP-binding protein [Bacillus fonticola]|uniref:energy-coupling factor ABC transporter ATP-binding protein n=1 Tax=Bacillus fonticola TaxID=2728853 RepID=UPI001475B638|nr:energy-coupling factor ABC transporter ATP-binding protein [Bacillus fonticola]
MDIRFQEVGYTYQPGTPFEHRALSEINLDIEEGSYWAIIGHTGSGKSTLLQHLNALLTPTEGEIKLGEYRIRAEQKAKRIRPVRKQVGIVFQFPEHQLFEENVVKDICFGPMNFGVSKADAEKRAREAAELVGLPQELLERSPFDLSGGQMRRVAIAGVLAMEPEVLVLDEPTAGLDPRGRKEMMNLFARLRREKGLTIVLVTHSMEDAAQYADRIAILRNGQLQKKGTTDEIFSNPTELVSFGLDVPSTVRFQVEVAKRWGHAFRSPALNVDDLAQEIATLLAEGGGSSSER